MPSIPLYGFDELEPSILNNAKRRVVGLLDVSQEQLTEKPETDPTNGKQNTFVEKLTEEIYTIIKDIEVMDTYISDTTSISELKLFNNKASLNALRAELKKSASQIASVNNGLRKINATYEKLRPNMVYTELKTFIGFVNSVKILKKSALAFFTIVDALIDDVRSAVDGDTSYKTSKPPISDKDEEIIDEEPPDAEPPPSGVPFPSEGVPSTPFEPIIPPLPPPPPPPPPPPRPPYKGNIGKKISEYRNLIGKLIQDNNIADANDKDLITNYAMDYVRQNKAFLTEQEIQDYIDNQILNPPQLPVAPIAPITPAPAPSTAPPTPTQNPNETYEEMVGRVIGMANLTKLEITMVGNAMKDYQQNHPTGDVPDEGEINDMITQVLSLRASSSSSTASPLTTDKASDEDIDDMINRSVALRSIGIKSDKGLFNAGKDKLEKAEKKLTDKRRVNDLLVLKRYVEFAEEPLIKIDQPDLDALPKLKKAYKIYKDEKKKLNLETKYKKDVEKIMKEENITAI
jgi:hypothetical protein